MKTFMEILLEKNCFCKTDSTERLYAYNEIEKAFEEYKESVPAETLVSLQKADIEQQENFMKILKDIYKADDMVEMQTLIEIYFENIDSCLLNKYNYESDVSLLSS